MNQIEVITILKSKLKELEEIEKFNFIRESDRIDMNILKKEIRDLIKEL